MEKEEQKSRRNSTNTVKHRKHSLGLQTERTLYNTGEREQVQRRRRRSQGLTIKIESPTTGEDSSAGIISSPGNIYLSGVSISRGPTPLSSPGGRNSRSPSLSMPPASPVARNRVRSASLAVPSHAKTPPHSPGRTWDSCLLRERYNVITIIYHLKHYHWYLKDSPQVVCPWRPVSLPTDPNTPTHTSTSRPRPTPSPGWAPSPTAPPPHSAQSCISRFYQRKLSGNLSQINLQDANLSSDDFHEALLLNKLQKTPKKRKKSKKSRSNSKDLNLHWDERKLCLYYILYWWKLANSVFCLKVLFQVTFIWWK